MSRYEKSKIQFPECTAAGNIQSERLRFCCHAGKEQVRSLKDLVGKILTSTFTALTFSPQPERLMGIVVFKKIKCIEALLRQKNAKVDEK